MNKVTAESLIETYKEENSIDFDAIFQEIDKDLMAFKYLLLGNDEVFINFRGATDKFIVKTVIEEYEKRGFYVETTANVSLKFKIDFSKLKD